MPSNKAISAGIQEAWISPIGIDKNIILGATATAPATGTGSHAIQLVGIQSYDSPIPEGDNVNISGDDDTIGSIPFPSDAAREFILSVAEHDISTDALLQGTSVVTENNMRMAIEDPENPDYPDICLIANSKSRDTDTNVVSWTTYVYPSLQLTPLGRAAFANREAAAIRYKASVQKATNTPWGLTITGSNFGTTKGTNIKIHTNYPLAIYRLTGDGSTTDFVLTKTPSADENDTVIYQNGTKTDPSGYTMTAATKTLSFTSPPADGVAVAVLYGYTD